MKNIISLSVLLSLSFITPTYANTVTLKPSLYTQMKYQEQIDRTNAIIEKKLKNKMRLAEIKSRKDAEKYKTTPQYSIINTNTSNNQPITPGVSPVKNVDMNIVRGTWINWYNEYRSSLGLGKYSYDSRLDTTAHAWNIRFAEGK